MKDLVPILQQLPRGTKLWACDVGAVTFDCLNKGVFSIEVLEDVTSFQNKERFRYGNNKKS